MAGTGASPTPIVEVPRLLAVEAFCRGPALSLEDGDRQGTLGRLAMETGAFRAGSDVPCIRINRLRPQIRWDLHWDIPSAENRIESLCCMVLELHVNTDGRLVR